MLEMPFQRPQIQNIFGGACPGPLEMCRHFSVTPPPPLFVKAGSAPDNTTRSLEL